VLDANGVIRYKDVFGKELGEAAEALVTELKEGSDKKP
jgi:hypothetical protein